MPLFIKTNLDPEGTHVRIDGGFRGADGNSYLLLQRLPPLYAAPPWFIVRLSSDRIEHRGSGEDARTYFKAYAIQGFSKIECDFLRKIGPGSVSPFFDFRYPNIIRVMGKRFEKLLEDDFRRFISERHWKLIPPL